VDKPCGCQFFSKDDLGREVWADFEVYACNDVGIRTSPEYTTVPGITAQELIENLKLCFKRCGCEVWETKEIKPPSSPSRREYIAKEMSGKKFGSLGEAQRAFAELARKRV
jgi:hypothetical protein